MMGEMNQTKAKLLERVKKNLRPTLISQKGGVSLERLNRDYSDLMGEGIPFRQLQFHSMEAFLRSIPDICSVEWGRGELMVAGVADESTQHIVKMVRMQKTKTRKKKAGGPTRPVQRQPVTWGGGRRDLGRGGGRYNGNNMQMSGIKVTIGSENGRVSVRSGGSYLGGYQGHSAGAIPRGYSYRGSNVVGSSYGNVDGVKVGMKNLTVRERIDKETLGGEGVFGPRVGKLLEGRVYGLFSSQLEKMYEKKWEETLPRNWCQKLSSSGVLRMEQQTGQTVVYWSDTGYLAHQPAPHIAHSPNNPHIPPPAIYSFPPPPVNRWPYPSPQTRCSNSPERHYNQNPNENSHIACSSLTEVNPLLQGSRQDYRQPPPFLPSPSTSTPSQECPRFNHSQTSLPPLPFPQGSNWDINVCMVTASNQIFFQFNDNSERLEELVTAMDDFYTINCLPLARSKLSPGQVCCANVDGGFYRVKILNQVDAAMCNCLFLDIGLENQIDCDDLQELPPQFLQLPGQAVPACLAKVDHWVEEEVLEFVTKYLDGESFVALVDNREELGNLYTKEQEVPFLFLMDSNCTNMAVEINKFLVKFSSNSLVHDSNKDQGLLVSSSEHYPEVTSSKSPGEASTSPLSKSNNSSLVTSSLIPEVSSSFLSSPEKSISSFQLHVGPLPVTPLPPPGSLYDLTVTQATSPDQFQIVSYLQKAIYSTLISQLTEYYSDPNNHTPITDDHLGVGSVLAFRDCTTWQRAKVVRVVNLHPLAVALKLVDQGCFKACTSPDDIQPMRVQFAKLPPQACTARLDGMQAGVSGWGEEVLDWFRETTLDMNFVAKVKDIVTSTNQEKVLVLDLIDTSKPNIDININKEVMNKLF